MVTKQKSVIIVSGTDNLFIGDTRAQAFHAFESFLNDPKNAEWIDMNVSNLKVMSVHFSDDYVYVEYTYSDLPAEQPDGFDTFQIGYKIRTFSVTE